MFDKIKFVWYYYCKYILQGANCLKNIIIFQTDLSPLEKEKMYYEKEEGRTK